MVRVFTYNFLSKDVFPYGNGMHEIDGVKVSIHQGIFTENGKKHPDFVHRKNQEYLRFRQGLSLEDTVIGFIGKESSGATRALVLMLEDQQEIGFTFRPCLCRHVEVTVQSLLIQRRIPYVVSIDYEERCQEGHMLLCLLLEQVFRIRQARTQ